jgi:hypothetical protein
MICKSCNFINPKDNRFCQNCGATMPESEPEIVTQPAPSTNGLRGMVANTTENKSYIISRNEWDMRLDFFLPITLAGLICHLIWQNFWASIGVLAAGLIFSIYKTNAIQSIVHKTIPVELIGKVIIAYGPANTKGRLHGPSGVLYLLSEGLYYKSYSDKDEFAFVHVNQKTSLTATAHHQVGWIREWEEVHIHYDSGDSVCFSIYNASTWLMMISLVCGKALRDEPQEMLVEETGGN